MTEATGWAVLAPGARIYVNTIAETRRAAIVNWLVTEKKTMVFTHNTDDDIERLWKHFGEYVDCRQITITDAPQSASDVGSSQGSGK
jgi:hypothetical protein